MTKGGGIARKRYTAEQIISHLRTAEIETGKGLRIMDACRKLGITEQTYYQWKKEYAGLRIDQANRLMGLEQENTQLKRLVADLSLDNSILKEVAAGNFLARPDAERRSSVSWTRTRSQSAGLVEWWGNAGPPSSMCPSTRMTRTDWCSIWFGGFRLHPISQVAIAKKIKIDNKS